MQPAGLARLKTVTRLTSEKMVLTLTRMKLDMLAEAKKLIMMMKKALQLVDP